MAILEPGRRKKRPRPTGSQLVIAILWTAALAIAILIVVSRLF
ncbi:MAG TPA: hypothetical protein VFM41_13360 [Gaiella sp.]|jgi:hypothetical protein|nr:hypothetical protein [Gaiella sp.]